MQTPKTTGYDIFRSTNFFPSLDGLRAIAVILVYCVHFGGSVGVAVLGRLGVQVFFVLSGFLITTLLLRENDETRTVDFRRFYIRRAFRILPVFYVVLLLTIWQTSHLTDWWGPLKRALPYYATFFGEVVHFDAPWKLVWSLGIEWKFYLVWPVLAFAVARSARARWLAAVIIVTAAAALWWDPIFNVRQYIYLMLGVFLAMAMHSRRGFAWISPLMHPIVSLVLFVAYVVFQLNAGKIFDGIFIPKVEIMYTLVIVVLLPTILGPGLPKRLLSSAPFAFIGKRSYSMYLIQPFAEQAVEGISPWPSLGIYHVIQVAIVGIIFSDVLYRCIEKPMIAVGNSLVVRLNSSVAMSPRGTAREIQPRP